MIGKAIKARLTAHSGTDALVGGRIYPLRLPQGPTYPAVRYQVISAPRTQLMGGPVGEVHARVQVDCYALTYEEADQLSAQVRIALNRWDGTSGGVVVEAVFLENERDIDEPETIDKGERGVYRKMLDFMAHYAEAVA